ncbi:hypothetical protein [Helicobacter sp. T3_23-1056]
MVGWLATILQFLTKSQNLAMTENPPPPNGLRGVSQSKSHSAREGAYFGLPRRASTARNDRIILDCRVDLKNPLSNSKKNICHTKYCKRNIAKKSK